MEHDDAKVEARCHRLARLSRWCATATPTFSSLGRNTARHPRMPTETRTGSPSPNWSSMRLRSTNDRRSSSSWVTAIQCRWATAKKPHEKSRNSIAFRDRAKLASPGGKVNRVYAVFNSLEEFKDKIASSLTGELCAASRSSNDRPRIRLVQAPPDRKGRPSNSIPESPCLLRRARLHRLPQVYRARPRSFQELSLTGRNPARPHEPPPHSKPSAATARACSPGNGSPTRGTPSPLDRPILRGPAASGIRSTNEARSWRTSATAPSPT